MMRIGVNTLFLIPTEVGGTEIYVRSILPAMQAEAPDIELVVFTNEENHESFSEYERVLIPVKARSRAARVIAEQVTLPRAAKKARIDALYSPGYTCPLWSLCPQVVTIHDTQILDYPETFPWLSRTVQYVLVGRGARRAGAVTTVSEFSKGRIADRYGVQRDRIFVAHSSLSGLFSHAQPCTEERPFLIYIAATYPHKNATRLVNAFASIADRIPHHLVLIGQPRAGEPPTHPRVKRLHHIPYLELVGLVQAADLMVFPSLYEGFGRPVVEAQEAGTRVIAARAGSVPEIGGEGATYFDGTSEDAIAQAILDALNEPREQRERYLAIGRENAKRFTWPACARQTIAAIHYAVDNT
ncbi:MAG: glycosyltransferase family 4 protein [Candidatus Hydrogenedentes bacterium]|nr:glycosyltransferase family 4 protein [Candidatus Hydrogenedentota bacterium]